MGMGSDESQEPSKTPWASAAAWPLDWAHLERSAVRLDVTMLVQFRRVSLHCSRGLEPLLSREIPSRHSIALAKVNPVHKVL